MSQGVKASHLNRIITVLNDQILGRILDLLIMEIGPPPVAFCWLVMGSEGRKEQTFSTDQDNAIIFEATGKEADDEAARSYFLELAEKAVHHLAKCGYRLCKGDMMASNPSWTRSLSAWKRLFDHWIFSPDPKEVLYSTIFFDFRGGFGNVQLADELREHLMKRTSAEKVFIHHLARDCMDVRPPLSMFKQFKVEKEGPYKGQLDLKEKGVTPFVDFARLMCLDHGLPATNTLERFESLRKGAFISHDLAARIMEAYEFLMHVRLKEQLKEIKDGKEPDNFVMPSQLSDLDQRSLKKAFSLIGEAQSFIAAHFHLNLG
jgi:CBS domain-containing protein